jgi:hypothetical protein
VRSEATICLRGRRPSCPRERIHGECRDGVNRHASSWRRRSDGGDTFCKSRAQLFTAKRLAQPKRASVTCRLNGHANTRCFDQGVDGKPTARLVTPRHSKLPGADVELVHETPQHHHRRASNQPTASAGVLAFPARGGVRTPEIGRASCRERV